MNIYWTICDHVISTVIVPSLFTLLPKSYTYFVQRSHVETPPPGNATVHELSDPTTTEGVSNKDISLVIYVILCDIKCKIRVMIYTTTVFLFQFSNLRFLSYLKRELVADILSAHKKRFIRGLYILHHGRILTCLLGRKNSYVLTSLSLFY